MGGQGRGYGGMGYGQYWLRVQRVWRKSSATGIPRKFHSNFFEAGRGENVSPVLTMESSGMMHVSLGACLKANPTSMVGDMMKGIRGRTYLSFQHVVRPAPTTLQRPFLAAEVLEVMNELRVRTACVALGIPAGCHHVGVRALHSLTARTHLYRANKPENITSPAESKMQCEIID